MAMEQGWVDDLTESLNCPWIIGDVGKTTKIHPSNARGTACGDCCHTCYQASCHNGRHLVVADVGSSTVLVVSRLDNGAAVLKIAMLLDRRQ